MITVTWSGDTAMIARLQQIGPKILQAAYGSVQALAIELTAKVKSEKLSGQVLKNRTGTLRRSINYQMESTPTSVMAEVGTNVVYGHIHEYGGKTPPHEILPKTAKALKFQLGGKTIFAKKVNHPGSQMPERSFLRSALKDMEGRIRQKLMDDLKRAVQG